MTGFSIDWLDLREGADRRARADKLLAQVMHWLGSDPTGKSETTIVDLGAGTGSTLRAFAASIAGDSDQGPLSWHLVDQDTELLAEARHRHGDSQPLQTHELDLTNIAALPLKGAKLITASALFDLVSVDFIERLAAEMDNRCREEPVGLYSALNYDGTTSWEPVHPLDADVLNAFNRDQQRDKGFGLALGPDAGACIERVFNSLGFNVYSADSPWVLGGDEHKLVDALISGIGDAVAQDPALDAGSLQDWIQFRKTHSSSGSCMVGHTDLLVLPGSIDSNQEAADKL